MHACAGRCRQAVQKKYRTTEEEIIHPPTSNQSWLGKEKENEKGKERQETEIGGSWGGGTPEYLFEQRGRVSGRSLSSRERKIENYTKYTKIFKHGVCLLFRWGWRF